MSENSEAVFMLMIDLAGIADRPQLLQAPPCSCKGGYSLQSHTIGGGTGSGWGLTSCPAEWHIVRCDGHCPPAPIAVLLQQLGPEWLIYIVLGLLSCVMQHRGFDPPVGTMFPVEGIFPWRYHGF